MLVKFLVFVFQALFIFEIGQYAVKCVVVHIVFERNDSQSHSVYEEVIYDIQFVLLLTVNVGQTCVVPIASFLLSSFQTLVVILGIRRV